MYITIKVAHTCIVTVSHFQIMIYNVFNVLLISPHIEAWAKLAQQWLVGIHLDPINKELMLLVTI